MFDLLLKKILAYTEKNGQQSRKVSIWNRQVMIIFPLPYKVFLKTLLIILVLVSLFYSSGQAATVYLNDPAFFPIGVWLQSPNNATRFKKLGINFYAGLWNGPTDRQLHDLKQADMAVICDQNDLALNNPYKNTILGWLQQDEPDNSQTGTIPFLYTPPILPTIIQEHYLKMKKRDPRRLILLNLGQGVAWDGWQGRGVRTNHPEDYAEYVKGGDIISFDIYPSTHPNPAVRGRLEFVAQGVQRLKFLSTPQQRVWAVIGASRINDPDTKPAPLQVRSQVWMSIIHGARGIVYFVHQFKPRFVEAAVFEDPEMMREMTQLNVLIQSLAVVLNSPDTNDIKKLTSTFPDVPVAAVTKRHESFLYLLSVDLRNKETTERFEFNHPLPDQEAEVLGENRKITIRDRILEDHYGPYEPHIYRINL